MNLDTRSLRLELPGPMFCVELKEWLRKSDLYPLLEVHLQNTYRVLSLRFAADACIVTRNSFWRAVWLPAVGRDQRPILGRWTGARWRARLGVASGLVPAAPGQQARR